MKLIKFEAPWCEPCKRLQPTLDLLANERPDIEFLKIDVEDDPHTAKQFNVRGLPTLVLLSDQGDLLAARTGLLTRAEILSLLESHR